MSDKKNTVYESTVRLPVWVCHGVTIASILVFLVGFYLGGPWLEGAVEVFLLMMSVLGIHTICHMEKRG